VRAAGACCGWDPVCQPSMACASWGTREEVSLSNGYVATLGGQGQPPFRGAHPSSS
jgi:hypothetical protein